jgi:hypothetical protein
MNAEENRQRRKNRSRADLSAPELDLVHFDAGFDASIVWRPGSDQNPKRKLAADKRR